MREKLGDDGNAMADAVGGEFLVFGQIERDLLIALGLRPEHSVIDVGCGSGRLAFGLRDYSTGPYAGIDVLPDFVDYARAIAARDDWAFLVGDGAAIPPSVAPADFICFFSVLTHLTLEDGYRYLANAARFLKPGGVLVFSFLDLKMKGHWPCFADNLGKPPDSGPINQFFGRELVFAWAAHLGMETCRVVDADKLRIPLSRPLVWTNGTVTEGPIGLGQSVAVMSAGSNPALDAAIRALNGAGLEPEAGFDSARIAFLETALRKSALEKDALNTRLRDAFTQLHQLNMKGIRDCSHAQKLKLDIELMHRRILIHEGRPEDPGADLPGPRVDYYLYSSPYRLFETGRHSLCGWCAAKDGHLTLGVRLRLGEREYLGRHGVETRALAQDFPDAWTESRSDGFILDFEVPADPAHMRLEVELEGAGWCTFLSTPLWPSPST